MKKLTKPMAALLLLLWFVPQRALAAELLVPVGQVVGLELGENCVTVAAFDEALGTQAQAAGLQIGDEIKKIDSTPVTCAEDVRSALERSDGTVEVQITRGREQKNLKLTPRITREGPRLGVYLRQGVTGIGTVTWYDPDTGTFGALGHGVNRANGSLLEMTRGSAYPARVLSIQKGQAGKPGQLLGAPVCADPLGALTGNTARGVFGINESGWQGQALPVADAGDVRTGSAVILSTVDSGGPREYSVEILKIYPASRGDGRNLLIRVTDPQLLAATGGIVQGMSGSPIIQDGKLVGAVTHVLVNDPTTGYGIFIENMLDAAG